VALAEDYGVLPCPGQPGRGWRVLRCQSILKGMESTPATIIESLALELMMKGVIDDTVIEHAATQLAQRPSGVVAARELRRIASMESDALGIIAAIQSLADRLRPSHVASEATHLTWDRSVGAAVVEVFLDEARGRISELEQALLTLEQHADERAALDLAFRAMHNLKGESAALEVASLRALAHDCEDLLASARTAAYLPARHTQALLLGVDGLRAVIELLAEDATSPSAIPLAMPRSFERALLAVRDPDGVHEAVEEAPPAEPTPLMGSALADPTVGGLPLPGAAPDLATLRAWIQLQTVLSTVHLGGPSAIQSGVASENDHQDGVRVPLVRLDRVLALIDELRRIHPLLSAGAESERSRAIGRQSTLLDRLQQESLELRLVPLHDVFQRLQRTTRDTARQVGKDVELVANHAGVELEKAVVDRIASPLMHLVRNAIDHGLESTEERLVAGKPAQGMVTVTALTRGNRVEIAVHDDGRGLDSARILAKARARGLWREGLPENDEHIHPLIFLPGFSTAAMVSEISGRGVGLDVVHAAVMSLGGAIRLDSRPGQSCTITLDVPLSMALRDALVVGCGGRRLVIFQGQVQETVLVQPDNLRRALGEGVMLRWRDALLPFIDLQPMFAPRPANQRAQSALIITTMGAPFALGVDEVFGSQRLLVRPLGEAFRTNQAALGGCLLEDGSLALVLDPVGAMRLALARRGTASPIHAQATSA